jgi:hypothetical protein
MTDVHEAIMEEAKRRHTAEIKQQEDAAREALTARVSAAMEAADDKDLLVDWDCMADETVVDWTALAAAAVDVFIDYLRNPPVREIPSDDPWAAAGLGKP